MSVIAQKHARAELRDPQDPDAARGDEPEVETFTGIDVRTQEALWAVDVIENHVEYAPYIQLYAGSTDNSEPSLISDPQAPGPFSSDVWADAVVGLSGPDDERDYEFGCLMDIDPELQDQFEVTARTPARPSRVEVLVARFPRAAVADIISA